jgi:hypothetical protein
VGDNKIDQGIFSTGFWFGEIQFNEVRESSALPAVRLLEQEKVAHLMAEEGGVS